MNDEVEKLEQLINNQTNDNKNNSEINKTLIRIEIQIDKILKNGLNDKTNYWIIIKKLLKDSIISYLQETHEYKENYKGQIWIILNIIDNSLYSSIKILYEKGFENNYSENSFIYKNQEQLIEIIKQINTNIKFENIENQYYENYKSYKKKHCELIEEMSDSDVKSNDDSVDENTENNNKNLKEENLINFSNSNYFSSPDINRATQKDNFIDFGISVINPIDEKIDKDEAKEIINSIPTKSPIIRTINEENETKNNYEIKHCDEFFHFSYDNDRFIENFYNFQNNDEQNDTIKKQLSATNCSKSVLFPAITLKNTLKNTLKRYNSNLFFQRNEYDKLPFDNDYKITRNLNNFNELSKTDNSEIKYKNQLIKKKTNSLIFYLNNYYKKTDFIKFRTKNCSKKALNIKEQNYQCFFCKKNFKFFLKIIPLENIYWCSYYLRYMCSDCASEKYSIIPDFILKSWCFKKFSVSKKAFDLIEKWYKEPTVCFKKTDKVLRKSDVLLRAIMLRKKIHLIYDLMKCNQMNDIVEKILGDHRYLVLKEIIFSLEDLVKINDLSFFKQLSFYAEELESHLKNCKDCGYKSIECPYCKNIIDIYDVDNVKYCKKCDNVIHKTCDKIIPSNQNCIFNHIEYSFYK